MANFRIFFSRVLVTMLPMLTHVAGVAHAGNAETDERAARKACLSGNFLKGVELLSDLFISTKEPTHIYNQARCYEQNGHFEEAILRFREFLILKAKTASAEDRAEAEQHIATCQALLEAKQAKGAAAAIPMPTEKPSTNTNAPSLTDDHAPAHPSEPSRSNGGGLRIAGLACGGVGLLSIGAGIYFYTRAAAYSDKVSHQLTPNPSDDAAGKRAETLQWVFYSAGGAVLATGVALYILGLPGEESQRQVVGIAPWFRRESLGLSAQGFF